MTTVIDYTPRQNTDRIVVHCSATKPDMDIGEDEIRAWHKQRGWIDIGYNIVIRRNGGVEIGRPLEYRGAHVEGYNATSLGVCLIGGVSEHGDSEPNYTEDQWDSLYKTLQFLRLCWPHAEVVGHNDLTAHKDCPCFDVKSWAQSMGF